MELADLLPARIVRATNRQSSEASVVAVLEDRPDLGDLAVEVCTQLGLPAVQFTTSTAFHAAFAERRPRLVILDWRLEREVAAAVYMALRHRFAHLPVVLWTAAGVHDLPAMVAVDPNTRVVGKAEGLEALEAALRDAVAPADRTPRP